MALSWDEKNDLTHTCTDNEPPNFWEYYNSKPLWVANHNCDLIVQNGQCWWAVASPHWYCRKACGMCRDTSGCDDAPPPSWWLQKTCAEIVSRGDCWWAVKEPLNLCRQSCNACASAGQCYDREPPTHWTSPASSCQELSTSDFYDSTHCDWASLAPHNLCRKTCGRCEDSMCPQASCSRGVETGSISVVLSPTIHYMDANTLNQHIVRIPAGSVNVKIKSDSHWPTHEWNVFDLHSDKDLDVCLRDDVHPHCRALREPCRNYGSERCSYVNDCIVGTKCGQVVGDNGGSGNYQGMLISYSGDDNINKIYTQNSVNNDGYETITIRGPTTKDLWVDVSSDRFSKGLVSWSFERCDGSCTGLPDTPRPTPEPTPHPVECDDVPPPSYWSQNSCQDVIATRACQWAAYEPRNICRATCGVCDLPGQLVAPLAVEEEDEQPVLPRRRRRLLAENCEAKYPLWAGLLVLGSAALFAACVPCNKWCWKNKADGEEVENHEEPEVVDFSTKPMPPKLSALRKISSESRGELSKTGRQASLPKIVSSRAPPPAPPSRRPKGEWSF